MGLGLERQREVRAQEQAQPERDGEWSGFLGFPMDEPGVGMGVAKPGSFSRNPRARNAGKNYPENHE